MSFRVVPFDPDRHSGFVFDTFRKTLAEQWPWRHIPSRVLLEDLKARMALPGAQTLVAEVPGEDDAFAGWASVIYGEVLFAYTRHSYRRRFKVMTTLLAHAFVDPVSQTPVRYWTRAAERIRLAKGWPLYWRVTEAESQSQPQEAA